MSNVRTLNEAVAAVLPRDVLDPAIQESIVLRGDLSGLSEQQKKNYYLFRCRQVGLDPAAKPFDLLKLNGKEILYANASASQQLCSIHKLSTQITHRERIDDIYVVSVRVTGCDGRVSENQGAVAIGNARGDALANGILKSTTKAIRRAVLAHCGLGMMDEMEVETIPGAQRVAPSVETQEVQPIETPATGIVFMVPGARDPYAFYENNEDWVDGFLNMCEKINSSNKFSVADKLDKLDALFDCNEFVIHIIKDEKKSLYELVTTGIGKIKQQLSLALRDGNQA